MNEVIMMSPAACLDRAAASVTEENVLLKYDGPSAEDPNGRPVHPSDARAVRRTAFGFAVKEALFGGPDVRREAVSLVAEALVGRQGLARWGPKSAADPAEVGEVLRLAAELARRGAATGPNGPPEVA